IQPPARHLKTRVVVVFRAIGARVAFPGVRMELIDLLLHVIEIELPWKDLPVRQQALRAGDVVDEIADGRRLKASEVLHVQQLLQHMRTPWLRFARRKEKSERRVGQMTDGDPAVEE